jgi:D-xylose transport system permease protein
MAVVKREEANANPFAGFVQNTRRRVVQGDLGSLPILLGLVLIAIVFQLTNANFLTPVNLTNLMVQLAAVGTISVGVVLVLLIGEIDLSVGAVSGFTAAIMAVLSVKAGWPGPLAALAAVVAGVAIGLFQGFWFARLHVPSFVVTLAGQLGWNGALLFTLGETGTLNLTDPFLVGIANARLSVWLGWALAVLFVGVFIYSQLHDRVERLRAGADAPSMGTLVGRVLPVAAAVLIAVAIMNINRNPNPKGTAIVGVPSAVLVFLAFVVVFDFITKRLSFGRHIFAVGGSAEAARRAGINVERVRIQVFMLCSALAACGGVLAGSRLLAVNQASGSGDILLDAIAAAVIGGTSLFGGRGSTWAALLGALVIQSISNGMDLNAFSSSIKFMVTGAVLLLAVTIDAVARSRRQATGRS